MLDGFERKGVFRVARVFALIIICVVLISVVIAIVAFGNTLAPTSPAKVTADEVFASATSEQAETTGNRGDSEASNPTMLPNIRLPFVLQKYFNNVETRRILAGHIDSLTPELQQDYVDNLAIIVQEAETSNTVKVVDAINKYFELKDKRLTEIRAIQADKERMRPYYAALIMSGLAIAALFSLILVLLAIERNTRASVRNGGLPM